MIVLNRLTVREFRGIRELTLDLNGKSFAVCGPNGTGKSGIVDAIEFVLTGSISRLVGEGRGDLSIAKHAPHVDSRDNPERAEVSAEVYIPSLDKTATITRSVKRAQSPTITPDSSDVADVFAVVGGHPEFVLSRREIIKYVLATPGKRAEEVSALLHLERVTTVRQALQKASNAAARAAKTTAIQATEAKARLMAALGIAVLSVDGALEAANTRRSVLGLQQLTELTETTSLKDGAQSGTPGATPRVLKPQAQADIERLRDILVELGAPETAEILSSSRTALSELQKEPLVVDGVQRDKFIKAGLELLDGDTCPFCGTTWKLDELKAHVAAKVAQLEAVARRKGEVEKALEPIVEIATRLIEALGTLQVVGSRLPKALPLRALAVQKGAVASAKAALEEVVPVAAALSGIDALTGVAVGVADDLAALETRVSELPELSAGDSALQWLAVAQERLEGYREAKCRERTDATQAKIAMQVFGTFSATADAELARIYSEVEKEFAALYAAINPDDEGEFQAKLTPSVSKLGFDVDFYGKGLFPPGAYHSEGHQDGMGLCLYLALMQYLQGENFRFAVLDDVLMSVDVGHRREVCKVLKERFPNTQFILTTHDRIWMLHMKTAGVIGNCAGVYFRSWDVERGPAVWEDKDVWGDIEAHLKSDDVHAAAGMLRRYLEYTAAEFCHALRAQVEFHGDAQYQLGELLPPAVGRMRQLLRAGKAAAQSWKQGAKLAEVTEREGRFTAAYTAAEGDRWQVNATIHFNNWDNLSRQDFTPVVAAMRALVAEFFCAQCGQILRVTPERGEGEALRCGCGQSLVNLVKGKPAESPSGAPAASVVESTEIKSAEATPAK